MEFARIKKIITKSLRTSGSDAKTVSTASVAFGAVSSSAVAVLVSFGEGIRFDCLHREAKP